MKNSLIIALSLTVTEIFSLFYFPLKSKMATKKCEKFFPFQMDIVLQPGGPKIHSKSLYLLWFPRYLHFVGQKFTQNLFVSKVAKSEIFPFSIGHRCTTLWAKNSLEITLSLTVSKIFTIFYFPLKFKMATKSAVNLNFSFLHRIISHYPLGRTFTKNRSICNGF